MIASWTVAALTGLLLHLIARIKEKNLSHQGFGKFFKLRGMAGLANLIANVGGRFVRSRALSRLDHRGRNKMKNPERHNHSELLHTLNPFLPAVRLSDAPGRISPVQSLDALRRLRTLQDTCRDVWEKNGNQTEWRNLK